MGHQYDPYRPGAIAAVYNSRCDGKNVTSEITQEQIERMPVWPDAEPHPPLPTRQAVGLARNCLRGLVTEPERWRLGEAILKPFGDHGRWIYLIKFVGFHPPGMIDGMAPRMEIAVLMNGEVIEPVVTQCAPRQLRQGSDSDADGPRVDVTLR